METCPTCAQPLGYFHRICRQCRTHFHLDHERQKYCSAACRQRAHRAKQPRLDTMPCIGCGQMFMIGPGTGRSARTKYHNNACRQRAYRKRQLLRRLYAMP